MRAFCRMSIVHFCLFLAPMIRPLPRAGIALAVVFDTLGAGALEMAAGLAAAVCGWQGACKRVSEVMN